MRTTTAAPATTSEVAAFVRDFSGICRDCAKALDTALDWDKERDQEWFEPIAFACADLCVRFSPNIRSHRLAQVYHDLVAPFDRALREASIELVSGYLTETQQSILEQLPELHGWLLLSLLDTYDAVHGSQFGIQLRQQLFTLASIVARLENPLSAKHKSLLGQLDVVLDGDDTWRAHRDAVIASIESAAALVRRVRPPLRAIVKAAREQWNRTDLDPDEMLLEDIFCAFAGVCIADRHAHANEANVITEFLRRVEPEGHALIGADAILGMLETRIAEGAAAAPSNKRFASMLFLEEFDRLEGTNHAAQLGTALFRIANLVVRIDGVVSKEETQALMRLEGTLRITADEDLNIPPVERFRTAPSQPEQRAEGDQAIPTNVAPLADSSSTDALLTELTSLIGLASVKSEVAQLLNFAKIARMRQSKGLKGADLSLHMVFYGNPGTGKTTVARIIGQLYHSIGVLSRGHLIEADRTSLVAGYVGQTAGRVADAVERASGGVLFIDEAYALSPADGRSDFGQEAIDTLLKMMEDRRADLVVIVAGYPEKMSGFIDSNPGLQSRFTRYLRFEDYSPDELLLIFSRFAAASDYAVGPDAESAVADLFRTLWSKRDEKFGNARVARNVFELTIARMANRIASLPVIDESALTTIHAQDIPGAPDAASRVIVAYS